MNWITLACELLALWSLGRIKYFRAFPLFYLKLLIVTVAYSTQDALSEKWWDEWWALFQVPILILMVGSAIEAFRRLVQFIPRSEARSLAGMLLIVWILVSGACLVGQKPLNDPTLIMTQASFTVEASLSVVLTAMIGYTWYSPFRASRVAEVHFWLLTVLNLSAWSVDVLFKLMPRDNEMEWNLAHGIFTCAYCVLLLLWAFEIPRTIRDDASSRPASHVHPARAN